MRPFSRRRDGVCPEGHGRGVQLRHCQERSGSSAHRSTASDCRCCPALYALAALLRRKPVHSRSNLPSASPPFPSESKEQTWREMVRDGEGVFAPAAQTPPPPPPPPPTTTTTTTNKQQTTNNKQQTTNNKQQPRPTGKQKCNKIP